MLLQLASRICASCVAGVRLDVEPKGEIIEDMARFSLEGVLLNDRARPTCAGKNQLLLKNKADICVASSKVKHSNAWCFFTRIS